MWIFVWFLYKPKWQDQNTSLKRLKLFHCSCATSSKIFFSQSKLVTLQMKNANTLIWSCFLKNTTKQWFTTSYVISLFSSPPFFGEEQCCLILQVCQDVVWGGSVLVKGINKRELYWFLKLLDACETQVSRKTFMEVWTWAKQVCFVASVLAVLLLKYTSVVYWVCTNVVVSRSFYLKVCETAWAVWRHFLWACPLESCMKCQKWGAEGGGEKESSPAYTVQRYTLSCWLLLSVLGSN